MLAAQGWHNQKSIWCYGSYDQMKNITTFPAEISFADMVEDGMIKSRHVHIWQKRDMYISIGTWHMNIHAIHSFIHKHNERFESGTSIKF